MSAEHGWIISDSAAGWMAQHCDQGHHPHPNPTSENPERWDCDCGCIWRILTIEQIRQKFAHLGKRPTLVRGAQRRDLQAHIAEIQVE